MEDLLDYAISPAGPADAGDLGRIHVKSWRETYPGILPQAALNRMNAAAHARRFRHELTLAPKGHVTLIAEGAEGAVGYAAGALLDGSGRGKGADAEVFTLYVLRQAQGAGVGRALLRAQARVLQAEGAKSLMLFVLSRNEHGARLLRAPRRRGLRRSGLARLGRGPDRDGLSLDGYRGAGGVNLPPPPWGGRDREAIRVGESEAARRRREGS